MTHPETAAGARPKKVYLMSVTALMAAVTCILAPMSIPIGPVPISLTNLAIYLSLYLLGWKWGTVSYLVYVVIGAVGVPVFSGFTGGLGKLAGPTGGYIAGRARIIDYIRHSARAYIFSASITPVSCATKK